MKKTLTLALPLAIACVAGCSDQRTAKNAPAEPDYRASATTAPNNTGINERDRTGATQTPPAQLENEQDLRITTEVRRSIMDTELSTSAKNVKIITANGVVTLRGPVETDNEKQQIEDKAKQVVGVARVDNQLEVIPVTSANR